MIFLIVSKISGERIREGKTGRDRDTEINRDRDKGDRQGDKDREVQRGTHT